MKWLQVFAVVVVLALTVVGCRSTSGRSFGQHVDDKLTTTQVKMKLVGERFGNLFSTDVDTNFGIVHLTGSVATPEQRAEAERIASRGDGVKRVVNNLVVSSEQQAAGAAAAAPAASPASGDPLALAGEVSAIDRATGDVTLRTATGDVVVRLPPAVLHDLTQGQRLTINAGQP